MLGSIGMPELVVTFVIALLIFGPSKLPHMGRSIGEAIKGFQKAFKEPDKLPLEELDKRNKTERSAKPEVEIPRWGSPNG